MNETKRLINALQKAGYKVRYTKKRWGRGYKYSITGIGRANYKYSQNALNKARTLVKATRAYTKSDKTYAQRAAARTAKANLKRLSPEERELYREIRNLWKHKEYRDTYKARHPGATKAPSINTILKLPEALRLSSLKRRVDELKGFQNQYEMDTLAEKLEIAGRTTGVDVYDLVAKLRSGDYKMTLTEFQEFRDILIDSGNPNYWAKQINPEETILRLSNKLNAFFEKADK